MMNGALAKLWTPRKFYVEISQPSPNATMITLRTMEHEFALRKAEFKQPQRRKPMLSSMIVKLVFVLHA